MAYIEFIIYIFECIPLHDPKSASFTNGKELAKWNGESFCTDGNGNGTAWISPFTRIFSGLISRWNIPLLWWLLKCTYEQNQALSLFATWSILILTH